MFDAVARGARRLRRASICVGGRWQGMHIREWPPLSVEG